jgi:hypothetical protein
LPLSRLGSWFRYLTGLDESGKQLPMPDPMAQTLRERAKAAGRDARQFLAICEVFRQELATSPAFVKEVSDTLQSFYEEGRGYHGDPCKERCVAEDPVVSVATPHPVVRASNRWAGQGLAIRDGGRLSIARVCVRFFLLVLGDSERCGSCLD